MLKSVRFVNWKSFRDATLHIDPLTVLIGGNSSGKSNAIEGLQLLSRLAQGVPTETALAGSVRAWAVFCRASRHRPDARYLFIGR